MVYNRKGTAPWSVDRLAGIESATVDSNIEVPQYIQPVLNTGVVDEQGDWKGVKSSDSVFHSFSKDVGIPNGGELLQPTIGDATKWPLDMTGYNDLMVAINPRNGRHYALEVVMGPDTNTFANLTPVNAGTGIRVATDGEPSDEGLYSAFQDGSESLSTDVWTIFNIQGRLRGQKVLQLKITNNSGGNSNIQVGFMRLIK